MRLRLDRISFATWLALAAAALSAAALVATLGDPGMAWDEGYTVEREQQVRQWLDQLGTPPPGTTRSALFGQKVLEQHWPFGREEPDGHPAFYAVLGELGGSLGRGWLGPLEAHRLGPAMLFAATTGVLCLFVAHRFGWLAGVTAAGAWLLMPRVFAHAHFASYDAPLACLWFLTVAAFWKAFEGWGAGRRAGAAWSIGFAVLLGLAAATKFTGWLIPLPLAVWSAVRWWRARRAAAAASHRAVLALVVAVLPVLALAPGMFRSVHELEHRADSRATTSAENHQQRAARAAQSFREETTSGFARLCRAVGRAIGLGESGLPLVTLALAFLPAAAWIAVMLRGPASGVETPSGVGLPLVWGTAALVAPAITLLANPSWWHDPPRSVAIFLWSNLSRQSTTWIPTEFFGRVYDFALPWYNTLAWLFLTVPPLVLVLVLVGIAGTLAGRSGAAGSYGDPSARAGSDARSPHGLAWLLLLNAGTLLVIRALPNAPGHDGDRQLLGSFPFLACLAGVGAACLRGWLGGRLRPVLAGRIGGLFTLLALGSAGVAVWHYHPVQLSYYTELVGGVRGAARLGLEPTYYWDALDHRTLAWLNQHTGPADKVAFCSMPYSFHYLRAWGRLRVRMLPTEPGLLRWYVLQNRPGLFAARPPDGWLAEHGQPAYTRSIDGVPLVWIFPIEEYYKAEAAAGQRTDAAR